MLSLAKSAGLGFSVGGLVFRAYQSEYVGFGKEDWVENRKNFHKTLPVAAQSGKLVWVADAERASAAILLQTCSSTRKERLIAPRCRV